MAVTRAFSVRDDAAAVEFLARDSMGIWYGNGEAPQWARDGQRVRVCGVTRDGRVYRTGRLVSEEAACQCCVAWRVVFTKEKRR